MWKFIQVAVVVGFVYWNMVAQWTTSFYLPAMIGVMLAYVLSEICFDLRLWWRSTRKG